MSTYLSDLSIVSPSFARFVASELPLQSLTKKDIVKCLKALGVKNPEILSQRVEKRIVDSTTICRRLKNLSRMLTKTRLKNASFIK